MLNNYLLFTGHERQATSDESASTSVENPLQISPFLQNKPNFQKRKMKLNLCSTRGYENEPLLRTNKNKPNQTQPVVSLSNLPVVSFPALSLSKGSNLFQS